MLSIQTSSLCMEHTVSVYLTCKTFSLFQGSLAEHLCERLLQVMFEIWLLACARCFPPPTLWRTLREMCAGWRHHMETVVQWNRVCKVLTSKLLRSLYGPNFPPLKVGKFEMVPIKTWMLRSYLLLFSILYNLQNHSLVCLLPSSLVSIVTVSMIVSSI